MEKARSLVEHGWPCTFSKQAQPTLPDWLPDIEIQHLEVGSCSLSLRFWREGYITHWEVLEIKADKILVIAETN